MTKDNILYSIISLLVGLIIGFTFANSVNRNGGMAAAQVGAAAAANQQPLPPGHPAIPGSADPAAAAAARQNDPQMMAAINSLVKLAKDEPNNYDAQVKAAEAYTQVQRYEQAIEFLARANRLRPDDYETLVQLANANFDANHFEEAGKLYQTALGQKPDDVNVRTDLGLTFMFREKPDLERAVNEFRASLERNPNHMQTLQNLTVAYTRQGRTAEAQATLAKLEAINPTNPAVATLRADLAQPNSTAGPQTPETGATKAK